MCGIAGIVGARVAGEDLRRMAAAIAHRGPDGDGFWTAGDGLTGFAHRRLAIIDPDPRADQPMRSADGRLTIVFNGEVFNFIELRDTLHGLGADFTTDSDTEVILEAWRRWGAGALDRMNGMFAFAIHDSTDGSVTLARDRFGIKPLLYAELPGGGIAFASEIRGLMALPHLRRGPDITVARRLLFDPFGVEGSDRALVSGVRRLPAGHVARIAGSRIAVTRWWRTTDHLPEPPATEAAAAERFAELFHDAVRLRMRSDVALGSCLSGGFDSTAVVATMAAVAGEPGARAPRIPGEWRRAFVATFPGQPHDESREAAIAADWAGVDLRQVPIDGSEALDDIERVLTDLDDVYISLPSAVWRTYRAVRGAGVTVSLDGHGADEMMGGYHAGGLGFALRNAAARAGDASPLVERAIEHGFHGLTRARGLSFLRGAAAPPALAIPAADDALPPHWGALNHRLYAMFHARILPTILRNFDRMAMAHGVEVRMPFMDWRLVSFVFSLPDAWKFGGGMTKRVARLALADRMPETIRTDSHKIGFNSPMIAWLNGPALSGWALDLLSRPNAAFDEIVDRPALIARITQLTARQAWDWQSVGRLWPYINLRWYVERLG